MAGSCILGIGIWLHVSYDTYARVLPSYHLLSADNLAIGVGALTFAVAFCGCCGSWFQSKCLLSVYLIAVITIMIIEILLGVVCFVFQNQIGDTLQSELLNGIQHHYNHNDTHGIRSAWDQLQEKLHCCGVNNHTDWYQIDAWPDKIQVPPSCCKPINGTIGRECSEPDGKIDGQLYWKHGCYNMIRYYLLSNVHAIGITSIVFAFVQFTALVSAFLVIYTMDYKKDRKRSKARPRPVYNRIESF